MGETSKRAAPAGVAAGLGPTVTPNSRDWPYQFSTIHIPPPVNAKNMSSSYLRVEAQSLLNRPITNPNGALFTGQTVAVRGKKRKLPGGRASSTAVKEGTPMNSAPPSEDEEEDEESVAVSPASRTIVIHPGTHFLRIGLATDAYPLSIPSAIARRDRKGAPTRSTGLPTDGTDLSPGIEPSADLVSVVGKSAADIAEDVEMTDADGAKALAGEVELDEDGNPIDRDPLNTKIGLIRSDLRTIMRSLRLRPVTNGQGLAASYNARSEPTSVAEHNDVDGRRWTEDKGSSDVRVAEEAMQLACFSGAALEKADDELEARPWKLFRPYRNGRLDIHGYTQYYGPAAQQVLLNDLQVLWSHAISTPREDHASQKAQDSNAVETYGLGIPSKEWPAYAVIVILPDMYSRADAARFAKVVLEDMGFGAVLFQTEAMAATFGAGVSAACVVRIGGARSSVACVEEGQLLPDTRIPLSYGGVDITRFFSQLLQRANLRPGTLEIERNLADRAVLDELKHKILTLDPGGFGLHIHQFMKRLPGKPTMQYSMRTYDEVVLAPMCLFNTRVIDFDAKRAGSFPTRSPGQAKANKDSDEVADLQEIDDSAVTGAMRPCVIHLLPGLLPAVVHGEEASSTPVAAAPTGTSTPAVQPSDLPPQPSAAATPVPTVVPPVIPGTSPMAQDTAAGAGARASATPAPEGPVAALLPATPSASVIQQAVDESTVEIAWEASKVPLDVAVWNSLLASGRAGTTGAAGGDERVKRLASSIICTGGSASIPSLGAALEARLNVHLQNWHLSQGRDINSAPSATVIPPPRELDPRVLAWKGMAVLARLDSVGEMWIRRRDWDALGFRAVREKTLFF